MDYEEIVELIVDGLSIELSQVTQFGPFETIEVKLKFFGNTISESYCELPNKE